MFRAFRFLLITSNEHFDGFKIREDIERNRLYQVTIVQNAEEALREIMQGQIHCLVYNFEIFDLRRVALITDLRDLGYIFPVMVFARHSQKEALAAIQNEKNVIMIEKPYESKDVWGICQKLVQGLEVSQRIHRRFYTNQKVTLEKMGSGEIFTGHMFNMSTGGAYLELDIGRIVPGETLKMVVTLDKVQKTYNVDAQVVWSARKGFWEGKPAVGVRFIRAEDVYRNLLSKL